MKIGDYISLELNTDTRIVVYSDKETANKILAHHIQEAIEVPIWRFIDPSSDLLPLPYELFKNINEYSKERRLITGINSYLSVINDKQKNQFMHEIEKCINKNKINTIFLIGKNYFNKNIFSNPKYENSLQLIFVGEDDFFDYEPQITVISKEFANTDFNNWHELLKAMDQFVPTGKYVLASNIKQAGLNVEFLTDVNIIVEKRYGLPSYFPESLLRSFIKKCENKHPREFLSESLDFNNTFKSLADLISDEYWSLYAWYVRENIKSDSYLGMVLKNDITQNNFIGMYICDTAIQCFGNTRVTTYAQERSQGIKELGNEARLFISQFISKSKTYSDEVVAPWLNCQTEEEHEEIVRRVADGGVHAALLNKFPLLEYYLSSKYSYGSKELDSYFEEYRKLRISNTVTEEFVRLAEEIICPDFINPRDTILSEYEQREDVALLMVDGMGAQYFPLLCAYGHHHMLNIHSKTVASVKMPTTTNHNEIEWNKERIDSRRGIDNVSHHGKEKYENNPPEQNFVASLSKFNEVFKSIINALEKYKYVVVTADHGVSELARIASEKKLCKIIKTDTAPQHIRYTEAISNKDTPKGLEADLDVKNNKKYWVAKGYNRLNKKGAMPSHGGASLEERLVPVIVFSQNMQSDKFPMQMIEESEYDI